MEIVISLGILSTIFSLGAFVSMDLYRSHVFAAEKMTLLTLLQKARGQSLHHINSAGHGVAIQSNAYIAFTGASYAQRDSIQDISFPAAPTIQRNGISEIAFTPLDAQVLTPGTITLSDTAHSATIVINAEGGVDWQ